MNAEFIDSPWLEGQLTIAIHVRPFHLAHYMQVFILLKHTDLLKMSPDLFSLISLLPMN